MFSKTDKSGFSRIGAKELCISHKLKISSHDDHIEIGSRLGIYNYEW